MEVQVWLGMREIQRSVEEACTIAQIPEWANQVGERENSHDAHQQSAWCDCLVGLTIQS